MEANLARLSFSFMGEWYDETVLFLLTLLSMLAPAASSQIDAQMLQNPDISQTNIVFTYAGDVWVVAKEGGTAQRLSSCRL